MTATSDPNTVPLTLETFSKLFDNLSDLQPNANLDFVELAAGEVLFRQGDVGEHVYVLLTGSLDVLLEHPDGSETTIDHLTSGAMVGEMAILSGGKRSATVVASDDSRLARLSRSALDDLAEEKQDRLVEAAVPRWQRLQLAKALNALFGNLDAAALHALQAQVEWQHLAAGDVLFRQGDPSDGMYLVISGRLLVTVMDQDGEAKTVNELGPRETVGEFALLTSEPRSATIYAARDTTVARLSTALFERLARQHPDLMRRLAGIVVERLHQEMGHKKVQAAQTMIVALLPASPAVDTWQIAQELASALGSFGPTTALDAAHFDVECNNPGAANTTPEDPTFAAVAAWTDEFESSHQYVLYVADYAQTAWTSRCLGQADRVLIITDPMAEPGQGDAELLLDARVIPIRAERVFWHQPATEQPSGTLDWLDVREVHTHYHVRQGTPQHMQRLARRLTGNTIALALSGGSAYGFAYMGIYRALLETGIPIDYVGGTSMGALVGAAIARELSYDEIEDVARYSSKLGVMDLTLPLAALNASDHMTRICQYGGGDVQIEDLWIPYFCVSTNLSLAEPVIHDRGLLWRAARGSAAIPGVFLPIVDDGNILVDGSLMNNFPVDIMAERCESDRIIGGLVMPYREFNRQYDYDTSLSGWRILLNRLNPFSKRLRAPSLLKTLLRSMDINGLRLTKSQQDAVELLILPDVREFASSEFDKWEPLAEIGYNAAIDPLRKWKEKQADLLRNTNDSPVTPGAV